MKHSKISNKVALGGIISGLSLLFMFLTGIFPFAEYALPALSGIVLITLVIEINKKTAYIAFIAVGILSLIITPVKESAILFVFFFGYYPILKSSLEKVKNRVFEWCLKIGIFNVTVVCAYILMINILGMNEITSDFNGWFEYGAIALLLLGNVAFIIYDYALTQVIGMYYQKIRPKLSIYIK